MDRYCDTQSCGKLQRQNGIAKVEVRISWIVGVRFIGGVLRVVLSPGHGEQTISVNVRPSGIVG